MKKNSIVMAMTVASSLLLALSCQKELTESANRESSKSFTATIEQEMTKTTLSDGTKVLWESGDCININGSGYAATPLEPATTAKFTERWWGDEPASPYHAIFPASLHNGSGFEFPESQEYVSGKFNAPMYAESDNEILSFKNICGVLCFSLTGTDKVKRISVTANEPLCGPFTVSGTTVNLTGTGKTVTLFCDKEGALLSQTPTKFYIYLPPKVYTSGMKITITNTEEDVFEKVTKVDATVARSTVYTFDWNVTFSPVLTGQFSVSATEKVTFSQGNLHATKVGDKWMLGFYERQNQVNPIPTVTNSTVIGARTASANDKEIDLFTWGYGSSFTTDPATLSFAAQSFIDWGTQIGIGSSWRTLSSGEWEYLLARKGTNSNDLSRSNVEVCGVKGCLVIAPDVFMGEISDYYDEAAWATAEKTDGLVCLPSSGHRFGVGVGDTGRLGFYWTSTSIDDANANSLSLSKWGQSVSENILYADAQEKKFSGWNSAGGTYSDEKVTEGGIDCYKISHSVCTNSWDAQFSYQGLSIDENSEYLLKIKAKVSSGTYNMLPMLQNPDTWGSCNATDVNLTTEWQEFERIIVTTNLGYSDRLTFNIGDYAGDVYVAYVKLEKVTSGCKTEVRGVQGFPDGVGHAFGFGPAGTFNDGVVTVDGIRCHQMTNTNVAESYSAKYQVEFPEGTFHQGKKCRIRIKAKASANKSVTCYLLKEFEGQYPNCGTFPTIELTTDWQEFVIETTCEDSDATALAFDFGDFNGTIYLAEFAVYNLVDIPFAATTQDGVGIAANDKKYGLSVRLVRNFNPAANLNALYDNNNYGALFE